MIVVGNDLRKLLRALEDQGFTVERTGKGHWLVRNSEGRTVANLAGTPSAGSSWRNGLAPLKRAGFIWPPPRKKRR